MLGVLRPKVEDITVKVVSTKMHKDAQNLYIFCEEWPPLLSLT
jgi:hypothetical protein